MRSGDLKKGRMTAQRRERVKVRSSHPGLASEAEYLLKERGAAVFVEMGGDLIEKHQRTGALVTFGDQFSFGQDEADQQRFLLSRRT